MPKLSLALPPLDLLAHNLVAVLVALLGVMIVSELIVSAILRLSKLFLRASVFKEVSVEDREAFRKRVRRRVLAVVAIIGLLLLIAGAIATFTGHRALDLLKNALVELHLEEATSLKTGIAGAAGIALGALIIDTVVRALAGLLGKGLASSKWFEKRREPLAAAIERLRTAMRAVTLCISTFLIAKALNLPDGVQRAVAFVTYALGALYVGRFIVGIGYILVDVLFETSGRLTKLEGPLKYLGSLSHLAGVTKRTIDYFVYVGAATLIADELTPDTWISRIGRIGIRIIAIFYASRVLVELTNLFVREIFLGKADKDDEGGYQRRQTLVPVAMGLMRYGIYFSALVMVLRVSDIDPTPLLAGAGVIGVAVGLGAQAFVGDIVAGFFILFEDLLLVGDLVEVAGVKGKVEEIGVRITKIRDDSGVLHAIPNGEVRKVANHSKAFVNAVIDVHIPYEEDPRKVRALLTEIGEKALEEEIGKRGPLEVKVQELSEGSILLRVIARVPPGKDEDVGDVLRAKIVDELRSAKVGAPRARRAVLLDSTLRVGAPIEAEKKEEEDSRPPNPFEPKAPSDD